MQQEKVNEQRFKTGMIRSFLSALLFSSPGKIYLPVAIGDGCFGIIEQLFEEGNPARGKDSV